MRKDTPPPHIRQQLVRDKGGAGDLAALPKSQRSSGFAEPASGETSVIDEVLPEDNGQSLILTHPRAARVFVRQNRSSSLSLQLTTMSQQPAKFRVASGRAEFGADGAGFKTEDVRHAAPCRAWVSPLTILLPHRRSWRAGRWC